MSGSTLAFPTTRFRASSVGVRRIGASEHQVLNGPQLGGSRRGLNGRGQRLVEF